MSKLEYDSEDEFEKVVSLGSLNPGDWFRFSHDSFEDAMKLDLFYKVDTG